MLKLSLSDGMSSIQSKRTKATHLALSQTQCADSTIARPDFPTKQVSFARVWSECGLLSVVGSLFPDGFIIIGSQAGRHRMKGTKGRQLKVVRRWRREDSGRHVGHGGTPE